MSKNDVIILESTLEQKRIEVAPEIDSKAYYKIFCNEQCLKNYELSYEELIKGDTDGGDDGGIDSFFMFVNGDIVEEDFESNTIKKNPIIEVVIIQCKESKTYSEIVFDKLNSTTNELFDFTKDLESLKLIYNENLIDKVFLFKRIYLDLASKHPILKIQFFYCSKGDIEDIHPKVKQKSYNLVANTKKYFSNSEVDVRFLGAKELIDYSRIEKSYTLQLKFIENYISKGTDNYIILTSLENYFNFVIDDYRNIRKYIFESNVRDYQGNIEVNKDIRKSLMSESDLDFWWLNNGITILASKASATGKTIVLDNVQIVNGLQTTNEIYSYLKNKQINKVDQDRSILIRIIVTDDSETRDKIIKATNFQTSISPASLKATDRIQRNIEDFFKQYGLYYDRRKNYYKNIGKPIEHIISIQYLAQAILSILLKKPYIARSRPSSSIKHDSDYSTIFNDSIQPLLYLKCAQIMKKIENYIKEAPFKAYIKNNLRFHLSLFILIILLGENYSDETLLKFEVENIDNNILQKSLMFLIAIATKYAEEKNSTIELISKASDFTDEMKMRLNEYKSKIIVSQPGLFE